MGKVALAIILALFISGCATRGQSTFCDVAKPIRGAQADVKNASIKLKRQVNRHNRKGARLCGWRG